MKTMIAYEEDNKVVRMTFVEENVLKRLFMARTIFYERYPGIHISEESLNDPGWTTRNPIKSDGEFAGIRQIPDGRWEVTIRTDVAPMNIACCV